MKRILITGGTGFLGRHLVSALSDKYELTILGRSPEKLSDLWLKLQSSQTTVAGDICNITLSVLEGVNTVIHAAAMVRGCEHDIGQAIHTNVKGTQRLIEATRDRVDKVLLISSCAACNPSSVYGATKLLAERMFLNANRNTETHYSVIRFGNIMGAGVVSYFKRWQASNEIQVTDPRMTRFWITAEQAVAHILHCLDIMEGGEIFVPKQPSAPLGHVIRAVAPKCKVNLIGPQPGESMHATLVAAHEARYTSHDDYPDALGGMFIIHPDNRQEPFTRWAYDSYTNPWRLTRQEVKEMVDGPDSQNP